MPRSLPPRPGVLPTIWAYEECNGARSFTIEVNDRILATVPALTDGDGDIQNVLKWLHEALYRYC